VSTPDSTEAQSLGLTVTKQGDALTITWSNWIPFLVASVGLTVLNIMFLTYSLNERKLPEWFLQNSVLVSIAIIILTVFSIRYSIKLTPTYLTFKGGLRAMVERKVQYNEIKLVYWKTNIDGSDSSDGPDRSLCIELKNGTRIRISNGMSTEQEKFINKQIQPFLPGVQLNGPEPPSKILEFLEQHPFPLSLLMALAITTTGWIGPSELGTDIPKSVLKVCGWMGYVITIGICIYLNRNWKNKSGPIAMMIFIALSFVGALYIFQLMF
jgi:hypothetical protein